MRRFFHVLDSGKSRILSTEEFQARWDIHLQFRAIDILDETRLRDAAHAGRFNLVVARNVHYASTSLPQVQQDQLDRQVIRSIRELLKSDGLAQFSYGDLGTRVSGRFGEAMLGALTPEDMDAFVQWERKYLRSTLNIYP